MSRSGGDLSKSGWEKSEFPIICESCLGENPFVRMIRENYGQECKICSRPFTVFRWKPGTRSRFKKTEICQTCAKIKNVCQTCLLDLEYGVPIQVRDGQISSEQDIPLSSVNREYFAEQADRMIEEGRVSWAKSKPSQALLKLARSEPYNIRDRPSITSYLKNGTSGDVVQSTSSYSASSTDETETKPQPIEFQDMKSVFLGGITPFISEQDLRDRFYTFGEIKTVKIWKKKQSAFVTFGTHEAAESAINQCHLNLVIKGVKLVVAWGVAPVEDEFDDSRKTQDTQSTQVDLDPLSLLADY